MSDYGDDYDYLSEEISTRIISSEINKLDWENGFFQLIVVVEPGVSMEVGGSLNGIDGLSAMHRNRLKRVDSVIVNPPDSVYAMQRILEVFIDPNMEWDKEFEFEHTEY